jgi:hypothetical protein
MSLLQVRLKYTYTKKDEEIMQQPIRTDLKIRFEKTLKGQRPLGKKTPTKKPLYEKTDKEAEWLSRNVHNLYGNLKSFTLKWYKGVMEAIEAVVLAENKPKEDDSQVGLSQVNLGSQKPKKKAKKPAKLISRSNLTRARPEEEVDNLFKDESLCWNNKGFFGTPLPLIPDIRSSEVTEGTVGLLLNAFGVAKKFNRTVTLSQGPNKRLNRYLVFQYNRLIKSINGTVTKGDVMNMSDVIWAHDFYRLSAPDSGVCAMDRQILRKRCRKYWGIACQLLRKSLAFRIAVLKKTLGKVDRWFHRNFDIEDLYFINREYERIANNFDPRVKVQRLWINSETTTGKKWRPLGLSPYPWRIFTRGINNLLETFISGSWPDNQHGYKSGRGVHTAWKQILGTVLKAKYIFEYDFTGFFNTVKIEAVATTLHRLYVPKYLVAYMVNITSSDVTNITQATRNNLMENDGDTWLAAWQKYEYIHLFRKGYRSRGLPQGFALSPLLSVISLTVLDELEASGIKYVMYADDGIFYSDEEIDYVKIAQEKLDQYGIGAHFNLRKSRWVKKNNEWLEKLKFVGLVYDPASDVLSASTRNGATLKLQIGVTGLFTNKEKSYLHLPFQPRWRERDITDFEISNDKLFELYEKIYVAPGFLIDDKAKLYEKLSRQIVSIIKWRLEKYSYEYIVLTEFQEGTTHTPYEQWLYPLIILKEIDRESYYELVDDYKERNGETFNLDYQSWLKVDFWMWPSESEDTHDQKEHRAKVETRLQELKKAFPDDPIINNVNWENSKIGTEDSDIVLKQLVWFKSMDETPKSVKNALDKDNTLELGKWIELTAKERELVAIPKVVSDYLMEHGGKMAYTYVTWRNLVNDPIFATFIARLFQDTFQSDVKKQNFRLDKDRSLNTLMTLIDRYIGRYRFNELQGGIDIFNASSFCANLLTTLMKSWHKSIKGKMKDPYLLNYGLIIKRIINRRSLIDQFEKKGEPVLTMEPYPLTPYEMIKSDWNKRTSIHLRKKYRKGVIPTLDIATIARSLISIQEMYTDYYKDIRSLYPYKGVRWDTFSPKKILRPPFVKKWMLSAPATLDHPLVSNKSHANAGIWRPVKKVNNDRKWLPLSKYMKLKKVQRAGEAKDSEETN